MEDDGTFLAPSDKRCTDCGIAQPMAEFPLTKIGNRERRCYGCKRSAKRAWDDANRERNAGYSRAYRARHKGRRRENKRKWDLRVYGLTPDGYAALLRAQQHSCAICGNPEPDTRTNTYFNVDHDHVTGKVRGLLCTKCNAGLGQFRDDVSFLKAAIDYLERAS